MIWMFLIACTFLDLSHRVDPQNYVLGNGWVVRKISVLHLPAVTVASPLPDDLLAAWASDLRTSQDAVVEEAGSLSDFLRLPATSFLPRAKPDFHAAQPPFPHCGTLSGPRL